MRWTNVGVAAIFFLTTALASDAPTVAVRLADGFECPVGRDKVKNYYVARGFRVNGHLGEDWNGEGGGDTDLGDPVTCTAHGIVVFAQDYKLGWGNVVIVRHAYLENGALAYIDSLYGHLNAFLVRVGDQVTRGEKVGTIGNNHGQYAAHLHFELRKDITVGMFRSSHPRDNSVYWVPSQFIAAHPIVEVAPRMALVPINTFPAEAPPILPGPREYTPMTTFTRAKTYATPEKGFVTNDGTTPASRAGAIRRPNGFKVDRYEDLRPAAKP